MLWVPWCWVLLKTQSIHKGYQQEFCDDYFREAVGRDSIMGLDDVSADIDIIENRCTMESIVDKLLLEIGDAFGLHKQ